MASRAIMSHQSSKKHIEPVKLKKTTTKIFMSLNEQPSKSSDSNIGKSSEEHDSSTKNKAHEQLTHIGAETVSKAEILWALECAKHGLSLRAFDGMPELIQVMFPNTDIPGKMSLGRDKLRCILKIWTTSRNHEAA